MKAQALSSFTLWCLTSSVFLGLTSAKTYYVNSGQSIQAAIDGASANDRIQVGPGTYKELIQITKDGIDLRGDNAKLVRPTGKSNKCSNLGGPEDPNSQAGICVIGDVTFDGFSEHTKVGTVKRYVKGVSVTGFTVTGFSQNIYVIGAQDTDIRGNYLYDGSLYGILTTGSKNTRVLANEVVYRNGLGFIGICRDDYSGAKVAQNHVSGYRTALCIQTNYADIENNKVDKSCFGAFIDPGIVGAQVSHNEITALNPLCSSYFPDGAGGITIVSAIKSVVDHNTIKGQHLNGKAAGIIVLDGTPDFLATGNVIEENVLSDNDLDIFSISAGDNKFDDNHCTTSFPGGLCT